MNILTGLGFGNDPFGEGVEAESAPSPLLERINQITIETFGLLAAVFGTEWLRNTDKFIRDIGPTGAIKFFNDVMTERVDENGDVHYYPYKTASVAHKIGATLISDYDAWKVLGRPKKGTTTSGGRELGVLKGSVGAQQPLSIDGGRQHDRMKVVAKSGLTKRHLEKTVGSMYELALKFWKEKATGETIDCSDAIIQYVARENMCSFTAPKGSQAEKSLCPMANREDFSEVPRSVETLGQAITDAILLGPKWVATQIASPFVRVLQFFGLAEESVLDKAAKRLTEATNEVMRGSKEAAKEPELEISGIIESMYRSEKKEYTSEEIESITRLMFVVGQRTTSVAFEGIVMYLCQHPEWQDKLKAEIEQHLGDGEITFDKLHNMPILHHIVWEGLRLKPPVPLQTRELIEDVEYDGQTFAAGTMVALIHRQAQRDPKVFSQPEEFKPDRWKVDRDPKSGEYGPKRFSEDNPELFTFSMTPHQCCGREHALTVLKLGLVAMMKAGGFEADNLEKMNKIFDMGGFVLKHSDKVEIKFK